jgi:hypothetical protein
MTLLSRTPNAVSNFFFQSGCLLTIAVAMSFSLEALAKTKSDTAPPPESSSMMPERPQESVLQIAVDIATGRITIDHVAR